MKITISKTVEETYELELPAYRKNICYYYKIISETEAIQVCTYQNSEGVNISSTSSALSLAPLESSEVEFDFKFNEVITLLMEKASV